MELDYKAIRDIIRIAKAQEIPCYMASTVLGINPTAFLAYIENSQRSSINLKILESIAKTDLDIYVKLRSSSKIKSAAELSIVLSPFDPVFHVTPIETPTTSRALTIVFEDMENED